MNLLRKLTIGSVCTLLFVAGVGAMGQQAVRAHIGSVEDRRWPHRSVLPTHRASWCIFQAFVANQLS